MWNENVRCGSEAWADITCHKVEYNDTFGQKQSLISSVLFPEQAYNKYLEIDLVGKHSSHLDTFHFQAYF